MSPIPGFWITFEGIDGCGKSTQLTRCAAALQQAGYMVTETRNPGGTPLGQELRHLLLHAETPVSSMTELLLFAADRAQHFDSVISPDLAAGKVVLCDRHMDSTVAYQGAGRGLSLQTIETLNQIATQGQRPDLTFLFDADPALLAERVQKRGTPDRMESEKQAFHHRVRQGYLDLAEAYPERIIVLDALLDMDTLHQQVMAQLRLKMVIQPVAV